LCFVLGKQFPNGLCFDNDESFHDDVGEVLSDDLALIVDRDGDLALDIQALLAEFDR